MVCASCLDLLLPGHERLLEFADFVQDRLELRLEAVELFRLLGENVRGALALALGVGDLALGNLEPAVREREREEGGRGGREREEVEEEEIIRRGLLI